MRRCAIEPVAVQAVELATVTAPRPARRRIQLDDLKPVARQNKADAVVIAEGIRRSREEAVQLHLPGDELPKGVAQVVPGSLTVESREQERGQVGCQRAAYIDFREIE